MIVQIKPTQLSGTAKFPPSKSDSHRKIIAASLATGESHIKNVSKCDDVAATVDCMRSLGADIRRTMDGLLIRGAYPRKAKISEQLNVRESGSTLRFLIPIAYLCNQNAVFCGSNTLFKRPLSVYDRIAKKQGLLFEASEGSLRIGGKLKAGEFELCGNVSSQFISGLLFALPCLEGDSRIIIEPPFESKPYVDMTVDTLKKFGIDIGRSDPLTIDVSGGQEYLPCTAEVEGDFSGGAFLLALSMLHKNVTVEGIPSETLQGDAVCREYLDAVKNGFTCLDVSDCPDLGPILFAMAAYYGGARFIGTARLRMKESDRISAMKSELEKLGAQVFTEEDCVTVLGGNLHTSDTVLDGHNDHRIVMSLAVLLSLLGGEIRGAEAVRKSYPDFFDVMRGLGAKINFEE